MRIGEASFVTGRPACVFAGSAIIRELTRRLSPVPVDQMIRRGRPPGPARDPEWARRRRAKPHLKPNQHNRTLQFRPNFARSGQQV